MFPLQLDDEKETFKRKEIGSLFPAESNEVVLHERVTPYRVFVIGKEGAVIGTSSSTRFELVT